jgi:unsaturated rhamnogalacturonyl hydrolase
MANTVMAKHDSLTQYLGASESKRWQYDVAMLAQAIDKLGNVDPKYSKYMVDYVNSFIDDSGNIRGYKMDEYNLDNLNPGKNLITLYKRTGEEKYHKAILQLVEQMKSHPRTHEGGFWHKKRYPYQMWLDGIYMAEPFLAQYAREFNDPKWFDEAVFQISTAYKRTLDPKTGLLYHAYDESREQKWSNPETGVSPNFWSRSMGWYAMAIVDVLDYLPETHPGRDSLISILQKTCDALLKVRDPNTGLWYQVLDQGNREGNYIEGSGSAMFIYAFAKGAKKGYLDSKYLDIANKAFDSYINTLVTTDEKGLVTIHHICGGCGLGGTPYRDGSYNYYVTEKQVDNDTKGVGPFIFAALELDK